MSNSSFSLPIQVVIVGTGFAARKRAEAVQADQRSNLVAVVGHNPEITQAFCQDFQVKGVDSWEELVNLPDVDLVIICTINRDHSAIAQSALESGKHVVVEYPLALDPTEAANLITLARKQQKLLHVEHIELLGGLHQGMKKVLKEAGDIFFASYTTIVPQYPAPKRWTYHHQMFGFPFTAALSRIHRLTDLFGKVKTVSCQTRFWDTEAGYYRSCFTQAQLRFESGLIAEVTYGKGETFQERTRNFTLSGDRGNLIFIGEEGKLIRGEEEIPIEIEPRRNLFTKDTTLVLDNLIEGKPLYVSLEASLYALQVADAARESAETGKTVELSAISDIIRN